MNDTRAAQVQWATWLLDHRNEIGYSEGFNRMNAIGVWPPKFPIEMDCSSFVTLVAWLANGNDPNGMDFDHEGYTGTMLSHEEHLALWIKNNQGKTVEEVIIGDHVIYGTGTGWHVAIVVEVHGPDILTISHGQAGDPSYVWANPPATTPSRGYPADGRTPQTYLANVTDSKKPVRYPSALNPKPVVVAKPAPTTQPGTVPSYWSAWVFIHSILDGVVKLP